MTICHFRITKNKRTTLHLCKSGRSAKLNFCAFWGNSAIESRPAQMLFRCRQANRNDQQNIKL